MYAICCMFWMHEWKRRTCYVHMWKNLNIKKKSYYYFRCIFFFFLTDFFQRANETKEMRYGIYSLIPTKATIIKLLSVYLYSNSLPWVWKVTFNLNNFWNYDKDLVGENMHFNKMFLFSDIRYYLYGVRITCLHICHIILPVCCGRLIYSNNTMDFCISFGY